MNFSCHPCLLSTSNKCCGWSLGDPHSVYLLLCIPFTVYFHIALIGNMIVEDGINKEKFFGSNFQGIQRRPWIVKINRVFWNHFIVNPCWVWFKTICSIIARIEVKVRPIALVLRGIYLLGLLLWVMWVTSTFDTRLYCFLWITQWMIASFSYGIIRFGTFYMVMIIPIVAIILICKCLNDSSFSQASSDLGLNSPNEDSG